MAETTAEAIQFPDGDHVQLAGFGQTHHSVQLWSGILGAGNANIHELACDLPATLSGELAQFGQLHLGVLSLVLRAHPSVKCDVHTALRTLLRQRILESKKNRINKYSISETIIHMVRFSREHLRLRGGLI